MGVSRQTIEASRDAGEQSLACDPVNDRERAAAHYIGTNVARGSSKLRCEVVSLNGWRREKPQLREVLLEKAPAKGSWSAGGARAMATSAAMALREKPPPTSRTCSCGTTFDKVPLLYRSA